MNAKEFGQIRQLLLHGRALFTCWDCFKGWLDTPTIRLKFSTPRQMIRQGKIEEAHRALFALDAGVFV